MTQITLLLVHFHYLYPYLLTSETATVLILEYATIRFASPSRSTRDEALDEACSKFISSDTYNLVHQELVLSDSAPQLTEFILTHRLR